MSVHTLNDVIDAIVKERSALKVKKQQGVASVQKKVLNQVWESYNNWALDVMLRKKGADAPTFGALTFEFFANKNPDDSENYQMKCKPSFILSESFKRQYQLPKKKSKSNSNLTPTISNGETINFHKLALRYSKELTKDMIFTGFRDLVRKIGELIGSGKQVKINFAMGTLTSKDRVASFLFNASTLKIENEDNNPVITMRNPTNIPPPSSSPTPRPATSNEYADDSTSHEVPEIGSENQFLDTLAASNPISMDDDDNDVDERDEVIPDPAKFGAHEVQEEAFQRYIERLEADAVEEHSLNIFLKKLQDERDLKEENKKQRAATKAKNLQNQILDEIGRKEKVRKEEVITRKEPGATSAYPLMGDLESELAGLATAGGKSISGDSVNFDASDVEKLSNPYDVPVTRKFLGIPGVPKKGLGYRLSEGELLQNLQDQMKAKEVKKLQDKQFKLAEEKRYIDHINMEIDFAAYTKQLTAHNKKKELMMAWEREAFLKKMQKLRAKGDIEGLRSHKSLNPVNGGESTARSATSSFANAASVGFDSRK